MMDTLLRIKIESTVLRNFFGDYTDIRIEFNLLIITFFVRRFRQFDVIHPPYA